MQAGTGRPVGESQKSCSLGDRIVLQDDQDDEGSIRRLEHLHRGFQVADRLAFLDVGNSNLLGVSCGIRSR